MTQPSTSGHSKWVMIVFWPVLAVLIFRMAVLSAVALIGVLL